MKKLLKRLLITLGIAIAVLVAAVVVAVATFDANKYKPQLVDLVKERTHRTLTIDGDIGLTIFPSLGVSVGKMQLTEQRSETVFARVDEARVAVAILPLLARHVVVDRVVLSGLDVTLVKRKNGRTNFDDLLRGRAKLEEKAAGKPAEKAPAAPAAEAALPFALDISGIELKNTNVSWRDEVQGTDVRVAGLALKTGHVASGVPGKLELAARVEGTQPRMSLRVAANTGYRLDLEQNVFTFQHLDVKVTGDAPGLAGLDASASGDVEVDPNGPRVNVAGLKVAVSSKDGLSAKLDAPKLRLASENAAGDALTAEFKLTRPALSLAARAALSAMDVAGQNIRFKRLDLDVAATQGDLATKAKLATPVAVDLAKQTAELPTIEGEIAVAGPSVPNKSMSGTLKGSMRADWSKKQSAATDLALKIDDSNLRARVSLTNFALPSVTFDVVADKINVDHYLPQKQAEASKPAAGKGAGAGTAADTPIDLSPLKAFNVTGKAAVGSLVAAGISAQSVQVGVRLIDGRLDVNPLAASLYSGKLAGVATVDANTRLFASRAQMTNVNVGPLVHDAAKLDIIEGRGNVAYDLRSTGATVGALRRALAGTASLNLKDGAVKGIDLEATLRKIRSLRGGQSTETPAKGEEKTPVSALAASFVVKDGVAHNDDLTARAPYLRLAGAGDIDVGAGKIDYTARATVSGAAKDPGGKELSDMEGLTVPVHLTGPFEALKYRVDFGAIAAELAKRKAQQQIEKRLGGEATKSIEQLRNLLRKR